MGRNIIRSNYNSKARDTSRSCHRGTRERTRERERDQTHSYWYIPSAPRVNYSLLVMDSIGMMKMASGDGIPLRQGAGTGSRLVFGGYRGLRRWNSRSIFCSGSFRVRRYIWVQGERWWSYGGPTRQGARPGRRARPHPCEHLPYLLTWGPSSSGGFPSKINFSS